MGKGIIYYIAASVIPSRSANSIHVMKMCAGFANDGYEVKLIVPRHTEQEKGIENVYDFYDVKKTFEIKRLWWPSIKFGFMVFAFLASLKVFFSKKGLVYSRDITSAMMADKLGLKTIFEAHSAPYNFKGPRKKFYQKYQVSKKLIRFVVISEALKKIYMKETAIPQNKYWVQHDASDVHVETEKNYREVGYDIQVGYVGHLYKGRGIEIIVEMAKACPWAFFHIVGGNEEDIRNWEAELQDVSNMKLYGFVSPAETVAIRLSCDVLLAPYQNVVTIWQGKGNTVDYMSPLKVFEYMSAGKTILISDLPVLHEVLTDNETCLFCVPDKADSWIEALMKVRGQRELMLRLGQAAEKEFLLNYTWNNRAVKLLEDLSL